MNEKEKQKIIEYVLQIHNAFKRWDFYGTFERRLRDFMDAMPEESETLGETHCPMCETTFNVFMPVWKLPKHILNQIAKGKIKEFLASTPQKFTTEEQIAIEYCYRWLDQGGE